MSTIKSSDEHLTINADGSGKDIKFQANGVEKASISSAGAFTSTTIDATKLTGDLPAISGANLTGISAGTTLTGSTNNQVTTVTGANAIAGEAKLQFVPDGESKLQIGNGTAEDAFIKIHGNSQNLYWGLDDSVDTITLGWGSTVGSNIIQTIETDNRSVHYGHFHLGTKNLAPWNASGNTTPCTFWDDNNGQQWLVGVDTFPLALNRCNSTGIVARFYKDGGITGDISTTASGVSYNSSSDYRLKENVDYDWDATTRLKQLKPARFNFIADETNTLVDGFLAHEVQDIVPEAVSGEKDAMTAEVLYKEGDELPEGKSVGDVKEPSIINPQGIDQSKLVPLLVKTIQELEARIAALEA